MVLSAALVSIPVLVILLLVATASEQAAKRTLGIGFVLGAVAAGVSIAVGMPLTPIAGLIRGEWRVLFRAFVVAAIVEEGTRLLAARAALGRGEPARTGAIAAGFAAGGGFAFLENVSSIAGGPAAVAIRTVTSLPLHVVCGVIAAAGLARERDIALLMVLGAVAIHGAYDYALFSTFVPDVLALIPLLAGAGWVFALWTRARRHP